MAPATHLESALGEDWLALSQFSIAHSQPRTSIESNRILRLIELAKHI